MRKNHMLVYCKSPNFIVPKQKLIYNPRYFCGFSLQGQKMIEDLLGVAPTFSEIFDKIVEPKVQVIILRSNFVKQSREWKEHQKTKELKALESPKLQAHIAYLKSLDQKDDKPKGKKYFETNRKFKRMVPTYYKRSLAPRLTTTGSTFHGMKKDLLKPALQDLVDYLQTKGFSFQIMDLDMSAAHARIAVMLQGTHESQLYQAVENSGNSFNNCHGLFF